MKAPKWRCSSYWFLMKLFSLWNRAHKASPTEFEKTPSLYIVPARVSIYSHCIQWGGLLLFSCQVMYDSLWPCGLQHARFPCPSPFPRFCPSSCPLNQWCHSTVSSSVAFLLFWEGTGKQKKIFSVLRFHWLCILVSGTVVNPIAEGKKWSLKFSVLLRAVCWLEKQDRVWRSLDLPECSSLVTRCSRESLSIMPFVFLLRIFQRRNRIWILQHGINFVKFYQMFMCVFRHVWLFVTPWTVAHQVPLWNFPGRNTGMLLLFSPPEDLPNPGIKLTSPALAGRFFNSAPPMNV